MLEPLGDPPAAVHRRLSLVKLQEFRRARAACRGWACPSPGARRRHRRRGARRGRASCSPPAPSGVVVKAQVLVGGRGKAGGVKLAATADEAERVGAPDPGHGRSRASPSARSSSAPAADDRARSSTSARILDRASQRIVLMALGGGRRRDRGGRAGATPEAIRRVCGPPAPRAARLAGPPARLRASGWRVPTSATSSRSPAASWRRCSTTTPTSSR